MRKEDPLRIQDKQVETNEDVVLRTESERPKK